MKTKIKAGHFGIYLIFLLVCLIVIASFMFFSPSKKEVLYSEEAQNNDTVYADIVSITPTSATKDRRYRTSDKLEGFFCSCEDINGKSIRTYIENSNFKRYIKETRYSWDLYRTVPEKVEFDTPLRIHGRMVEMKNILSGTASKELVFKIYTSDRPTGNN